jgi:hypothetical protein
MDGFLGFGNGDSGYVENRANFLPDVSFCHPNSKPHSWNDRVFARFILDVKRCAEVRRLAAERGLKGRLLPLIATPELFPWEYSNNRILLCRRSDGEIFGLYDW